MIDLPLLAQRLTQAELMGKAFSDMTREQVETLVTAVISSFDDKVVPPCGWSAPYYSWVMGPNGPSPELIIPHNAHPRYHWWAPHLGGLSIRAILEEMEAPRELFEKHGINPDIPF